MPSAFLTLYLNSTYIWKRVKYCPTSQLFLLHQRHHDYEPKKKKEQACPIQSLVNLATWHTINITYTLSSSQLGKYNFG